MDEKKIEAEKRMARSLFPQLSDEDELARALHGLLDFKEFYGADWRTNVEFVNREDVHLCDFGTPQEIRTIQLNEYACHLGDDTHYIAAGYDKKTDTLFVYRPQSARAPESTP